MTNKNKKILLSIGSILIVITGLFSVSKLTISSYKAAIESAIAQHFPDSSINYKLNFLWNGLSVDIGRVQVTENLISDTKLFFTWKPMIFGSPKMTSISLDNLQTSQNLSQFFLDISWIKNVPNGIKIIASNIDMLKINGSKMHIETLIIDKEQLYMATSEGKVIKGDLDLKDGQQKVYLTYIHDEDKVMLKAEYENMKFTSGKIIGSVQQQIDPDREVNSYFSGDILADAQKVQINNMTIEAEGLHGRIDLQVGGQDNYITASFESLDLDLANKIFRRYQQWRNQDWIVDFKSVQLQITQLRYGKMILNNVKVSGRMTNEQWAIDEIYGQIAGAGSFAFTGKAVNNGYYTKLIGNLSAKHPDFDKLIDAQSSITRAAALSADLELSSGSLGFYNLQGNVGHTKLSGQGVLRMTGNTPRADMNLVVDNLVVTQAPSSSGFKELARTILGNDEPSITPVVNTKYRGRTQIQFTDLNLLDNHFKNLLLKIKTDSSAPELEEFVVSMDENRFMQGFAKINATDMDNLPIVDVHITKGKWSTDHVILSKTIAQSQRVLDNITLNLAADLDLDIQGLPMQKLNVALHNQGSIITLDSYKAKVGTEGMIDITGYLTLDSLAMDLAYGCYQLNFTDLNVAAWRYWQGIFNASGKITGKWDSGIKSSEDLINGIHIEGDIIAKEVTFNNIGIDALVDRLRINPQNRERYLIEAAYEGSTVLRNLEGTLQLDGYSLQVSRGHFQTDNVAGIASGSLNLANQQLNIQSLMKFNFFDSEDDQAEQAIGNLLFNAIGVMENPIKNITLSLETAN